MEESMALTSKRWDRLAGEFEDRVCDITARNSGRVMGELVALAVSKRRRAVLVDLGCGIGTFIDRFGARFSDVVGVDFSAQILARAEKLCHAMERATWLCLDVSKAGRVVGTRADLTVCLNVITSPSAAKRRALWSSVATVTKPGGHALVVVPSAESAVMVASTTGRKLRGADLRRGLVPAGRDLQKHFTEEELGEALARHGFVVRTIRRASFPWADEGLPRRDRTRKPRPWDWAVLARKTA
jgi:SAM-dependent methyltransferase